MRKISVIFALLLCFFKVHAQKTIEELYKDYTVVRTTADQKEAAIELATTVLSRSSELTNPQIANLNFHLGRLNEELNQFEKAIAYYEASAKLVPNYYVTHRALGNLYLSKSNPVVEKMNDAGKARQTELFAKLFATYKGLIEKAIPHLEKAQACDPNDENLEQITKLYKNIKDSAAIATLDARLKKLAVTCVDLLDD